MSIAPPVCVSVARSVPEVEALRPVWESLQWHPNADIDHFLAVLDASPAVVRPHVLLLSRGGAPEALLVGRIEHRPLEYRIGYKVFYRPRVLSLSVMYGGLLGNLSPANCAALVAALEESLDRGEAEVVLLNHLRVDSEMFRAAKTLPGILRRDRITVPNPHWTLKLPGSYAEYTKGMTKHRKKNFRRTVNRLESRHGASLRIDRITSPGDVDRFIDAATRIAARTYHQGIGAAFGDDEITRRRNRLAAERGWLLAYMMSIDGKPCAFVHGFLYKKTFFGGVTRYDPDYEEMSPGLYLFLHMIKDLCGNAGVEEIDFGFGDADYKGRLCNERAEESTVFIYGPGWKGIRLNAARLVSAGIDGALRTALEKAGKVQRLKTAWRNRRAPATQGGDGTGREERQGPGAPPGGGRAGGEAEGDD